MGREREVLLNANDTFRLDTDWQSVINCCQFCTAHDEVGFNPWLSKGQESFAWHRCLQ